MKSIILKIFTFTIITPTAFVLIFKPELVRTMIPEIIEKVYVAINNIIPIERNDDLNLLKIIMVIIMPIFAGIMRSISDFDATGILEALLLPLWLVIVSCVGGVIGMLIGIGILYMLFAVSSMGVIISYIFCCYIMFKDFENCNCNCDCHESKECCVESVINM